MTTTTPVPSQLQRELAQSACVKDLVDLLLNTLALSNSRHLTAEDIASVKEITRGIIAEARANGYHPGLKP